MMVKTWISDSLVFISISTENGGMVKAISEEKFVENYNKYVEKRPKHSKSKNGGVINRYAIETCYGCKVRKPISEFNCFGVWECPCFDCCDIKGKTKKKFSLPINLWNESFDANNIGGDINNVEVTVKKESNKAAKQATNGKKVRLTNKVSGEVTEYNTVLEAGKAFGMNEKNCGIGRLESKVGKDFIVEQTETTKLFEPMKCVYSKKVLKDGKLITKYPNSEGKFSDDESCSEDDEAEETDDGDMAKDIIESIEKKRNDALKEYISYKIATRGW